MAVYQMLLVKNLSPEFLISSGSDRSILCLITSKLKYISYTVQIIWYVKSPQNLLQSAWQSYPSTISFCSNVGLCQALWTG